MSTIALYNKVMAINSAVEEYFKNTRSESMVSVNNLFDASRSLQDVFTNTKRIRSLLRDLRDGGVLLKVIPSVYMDTKSVNTNWYFVRKSSSAHAPTTTLNAPVKEAKVKVEKAEKTPIRDISVEKDLLDNSSFTSIQNLPNVKQLDTPGLYCIKLRPGSLLPSEYMKHLKAERIIYIGKASGSLRKRFWGQELNATGHGTFFRSIGAVLGYTPEPGSLKSGRNYTFRPADEEKIKQWLRCNTFVNCIPVSEEQIKVSESALIGKYRPLLNIQGNPDKLDILEAARKKCQDIALGN